MAHSQPHPTSRSRAIRYLHPRWQITTLLALLLIALLAPTTLAQGELTLGLGDTRFELDRLAPDATSTLAVFTVDDGATQLVFDLVATLDALDAHLVAPDGSVIDESTAPGLGGEWLSYAVAADDGGQLLHSSNIPGFHTLVRLPSLGAGDYTVVLDAAAGLGEEMAVFSQLTTDSPVGASLLATRDELVVGESAVLSAAVFEGAAAVTGASVAIDLHLPDGTIATLSLLDDGVDPDTTAGDGLYSGAHVTTQEGLHGALATVTGTTAAGLPFERQSATRLEVRPLLARIVDLRDSTVDDNFDGLVDWLEVEIDLDTTVEDFYDLYVVLTSPDERPHIGHVDTELEVGLSTQLIRFDADELEPLLEDGPPLTFHVVELVRQTPEGGELADRRTDFGTTTDILLSQLQRDNVEITGVTWDYGVDLDGNGLYDELVVQVELEVLQSFNFFWSWVLFDAHGNELGFSSGEAYLNSGLQEIEVRFDAEPIGNSGVDGPYILRDLLLYGWEPEGGTTGPTLMVPEVFGQTDPYSYTQFEGGETATTIVLDQALVCVTTPQAHFEGHVVGSWPIIRLSARLVGDESSQTLCRNCGVNPTFAFDIGLESTCQNTVEVTAIDSQYESDRVSLPVLYDQQPPSFATCENITVNTEGDSAVVDYGLSASDDCSTPPVECSIPSGSTFPLGSTAVECTVSDSCGQSDTCSFTVHVVSATAGETSSCADDGFTTAPLVESWQQSLLGDATEGGAAVVGGQLELSATGSSLWNVDNGAFVYQPVEGDFRIEIDITEAVSGPEGTLRKSGLMLRSDLDPLAPRAMAMYMPEFQASDGSVGPALQFGVRSERGGAGFELASPVLGVTLPVRLALDRRGEAVSAYYSLDGGSSWQRAGGDQVIFDDLGTGGDNVLAGMASVAYDGQTPFVTRLDDARLCRPAVVPPPAPTEGTCTVDEPFDVIYLLDLSGSMSAPFGGFADWTRFDGARWALEKIHGTLAAQSSVQGTSHRAALVTFQGAHDPQSNLESGATIVQGLTHDLVAVSSALLALEEPDAGSPSDPIDTTPTAIALDRVTDHLLAEGQPGRRPVLVWITDGVPNIDRQGHGPDAYGLEEVQAIDLFADPMTPSFHPWNEVAWMGGFNGALGTYDGEPMANAMFEIERMIGAFPELRIYGYGLVSGNGNGLETSNIGLLAYAAHLTDSLYTPAADGEQLNDGVWYQHSELYCGQPTHPSYSGKVWADLNGDGYPQSGEPAVEGAVIQLRDTAGTVHGHTTSAADGRYLLPITVDGDAWIDLDSIGASFVATTLNPWTLRPGIWGWSEADFGVRFDDPGLLATPPSPCVDDDFAADPGNGWSTTYLGDADSGQAQAVDGKLRLSSNGSALWNDDNGLFLSRAVDGDFRAEVEITDIPFDQGGTFRKAALMVRDGDDPRAPRVMVAFVPHFPNPERAVLQFGARTTLGGDGVELAEPVPVSLPVKVALERRGDQLTVSYSTNGGHSWVVPSIGGSGTTSVPMVSNVAVGLAASSYSATTEFEAEFDDFRLCQPDTTPFESNENGQCTYGPLDVVYLLERSASMGSDMPWDPGYNRLGAAREALLALSDRLIERNDGSRLALVTYGGDDATSAVRVDTGLSTDLDFVRSRVEAIDPDRVAAAGSEPIGVDPGRGAPIAAAMHAVTELLAGYGQSDRMPVVVWIAPGLATVDGASRGPADYGVDELLGLSLYRPDWSWQTPGEVAWQGGYNGAYGTFDGQPMADAMAEIDLLVRTVPKVRIYGATLEGDGSELGAFHFDLPDFAGQWSAGSYLDAADLDDLLWSVRDYVLDHIECFGEL